VKILLLLLAVLVIAITLFVGFQQHSGYVIIHYGQTQVEASFWTAAISLLALFFVLYLAVRIIAKLLGLGAYFRKRRKNKRARNARKLTNTGLLDAINGRWSSANTNLEKASSLTRNKLLTKLFWAFCSHLEGNTAKRDSTLASIDTHGHEESTSLELAKSMMLMASNDWEKALFCLKILHEKTPSHAHTALLLAKTCSHLHEWPLLSQLLPNLKKRKIISEKLFNSWQEQCFLYELRTAARQCTDRLAETWKRASRDEKSYLSTKQAYIEGLQDLNEFDKAKNALSSLLKKQWEPSLCDCYARFPDEQADGLIHAVDKLCQQHPNDIACRRALGILCHKAKRSVRAQEILTAVVTEKPCRNSFQALADSHAADGNWETATVYLRKALHMGP
jgi:HemY protein